VRIFKTKVFQNWVKRAKLSDKKLLQAIKDIENGQYEASLGGYLYKKRIGIGSKGKSSGARTIIAFREKDKAFFVYGFTKNKIANISEAELFALKDLAKIYLSLDDIQINLAIKNNKFVEVIDNE